MTAAKMKTAVALVAAMGLFTAGTGGRVHGAERPLRLLQGHRDRITSVAFAPDGRSIATASWDGTARLWDAQTGKEVHQWDVPPSKWHSPAQMLHIQFSPDSQLVVAAQQSAPDERGVIVWDRRTGKRVRDFPGICAAITPDGKQIACGGWGTREDPNHWEIRLYELGTGKLVRILHTPYSRIHMLAFSPDGQTLFAQVVIPRPPSRDGGERTRLDSAQVRAWDPATGKERRTRFESVKYNLQITLSPDGRTLAFGESLDEIATGGHRVELRGHTQEVVAVAFSADGRTAATGSMDGTARVWDLPSGKEIARFGKEVPRFSGGWVLTVTFSPDGRTLVSAGLDKTAYLWDMSRITERRREPAERSLSELETDWKGLAGDAAAGYAALGRLLYSPKSAVAFLEKQLQSMKPVDNKRIERLLADLDSDQFEVREKAAKELEALAEKAQAALRKALAGKPSLEVRRRLEALLNRLDGAKLLPETIRQIRAVEALEQIGSPEARRLLAKLAAGLVEMRLTQEARAAVGRLAKRDKAAP